MRNVVYSISLAFCCLLISCSGNKLLTDKELKAKNYKEIRGSVPKDENSQKAKMIKSNDQFTKAIGEKEDDESQKEYRLPQYPFGKMGIKQAIIKNFNYPSQLARKGISGKVVVRFVIDKKGYVDDAWIIQSAHPKLDKEALRVVKKLKRFHPGFIDDKAIRVVYTLPFNVQLR